MDVSKELKNIKKKDEEIDNSLPELHEAVIQLKDVSIKMREELFLQDEILKKNTEKTEEVRMDLFVANKGTKELIEKEDKSYLSGSGEYNNCCYFILFIFFLILVVLFISFLLS